MTASAVRKSRVVVLLVPFLFFAAMPGLARVVPPVWVGLQCDSPAQVGEPMSVRVSLRAADLPPARVSVLAPSASWDVADGETSWTGSLKAGALVTWTLVLVPLRADPEPLWVQYAAEAGDPVEWAIGLPAVVQEPKAAPAVPAPGGGSVASITATGRAVYVDEDGRTVGIRRAKVGIFNNEWFFPCGPTQEVCRQLMGVGETDDDGNFSVVGFGFDPLPGDLPDPYIQITAESASGAIQGLGGIRNYCFVSPYVANAADGSTVNFGEIRPSSTGGCESRGDVSSQMGAWHLHNTLRRGWEVLRSFTLANPGQDIPPVRVFWPDISTFYRPGIPLVDNGGISMHGGNTWWEPVLLHEYGHHILYTFAESPIPVYINGNCDGQFPFFGHCVWRSEMGTIAWTEGFPDFLSEFLSRTLGTKYTASGIWGCDSAGGPTICGSFENPPHPHLDPNFEETEGYTAAILWDAFDAVAFNEDHDRNGSRDLLQVPFEAIWRVVRDYDPVPNNPISPRNHPVTLREFFAGFRAFFPDQANALAGIYDENHIGGVGGAELFIAGVGVAPLRVARGGTVAITENLFNGGVLNSGVPTRSHFFLSPDATIGGDEIPLGQRDAPSLPPGGSSTATTTVTLPGGLAPGRYWIGVCADSFGRIFELNEANNCSSGIEIEILPDAPPPPPATACFSDDFVIADFEKSWTVFSGSWSVSLEELWTNSDPSAENWIWAGSPPVPARPDSSYSFDFGLFYELGSTAPFRHGGVMFCAQAATHRYDSGNSGYTLDWIDRAEDYGLRLLRIDGGQQTPLAVGTPQVADVPGNLQIVLDAQNIFVYGGGSLLLQAQDSTYRGGMFGVWAWLDQVLSVDNVRFLGTCTVPPPPPIPATACFSDDFASERKNGVGPWSPVVGTWNVQKKTLQTTSADSEHWIWAGDPPIPARNDSGYSFDLSFSGKGPSGVGRHGGIMFCAQTPTSRADPTNYGYVLDWIDRPSDRGVRLARWSAGVETFLAFGGPKLADPPKSWQVAVDSETISVFGDGKLLLQADDSTYRGGYLGLWMYAQQEAAFDNVRFIGNCDPPAPPPPPVTACLSDDFSSGGFADRWTVLGGNWSVREGSLTVSTAGAGAESWAWAGKPAVPARADSSYSFNLSLLPTADGITPRHGGVMFCAKTATTRGDPGNHGYTLDWIDRREDYGLRLIRWDNGQAVELAMGTPQLPDLPATLQVVLDGTTIWVYGNGTLVLKALDSTYRGGLFGVWAWVEQTLSIDNVRYLGECAPPPPSPAPLCSLAVQCATAMSAGGNPLLRVDVTMSVPKDERDCGCDSVVIALGEDRLDRARLKLGLNQFEFDVTPFCELRREYTVSATCVGESQVGLSATCSFICHERTVRGGLQKAGDCNQDGTLDISDASCLLGYLFLGSPRELPCGDHSVRDPGNVGLLDFNGDRGVDLSDAVSELQYLFLGGNPHPLGERCVEIEGCAAACK